MYSKLTRIATLEDYGDMAEIDGKGEGLINKPLRNETQMHEIHTPVHNLLWCFPEQGTSKEASMVEKVSFP